MPTGRRSPPRISCAPRTSPSLQRQRASPTARLIDFPSGHHPFLSQPDAFAQSLGAHINPAA